VLGHELCGEIVEVGKGVTDRRVGDCVTMSPGLSELSGRALEIPCSITVAEPSRFHAELAAKAGADHVVTDGCFYGNKGMFLVAPPWNGCPTCAPTH